MQVSVTQVCIQIQRHGARYPTSGQLALVQITLAKLAVVPPRTDEFAFLQNYTINWPDSALVDLGRNQYVIA